ncbi:immunoglobulin kappa light chain-like, partial [Scomber scombrus]|uniref:immunoglobulin kappa light chain-like n=1 Tax=Scomber scombrus TaxID=13677 RepID=UPI002DD95FDA
LCCCLVSLFCSSSALIQTAEVPHLISLTLVEFGDSVTFHFTVSEKDKSFHWYKQPFGQMPQSVASGLNGRIEVSEEFKESRFNITKEGAHFSLTIRNVIKLDEAVYFCQKGSSYSQTFINGTFLAVNDNNQQKSVYVKQSPETVSVQLGDALTFQCSLLSKNKAENTDQCPGESNVYWFRSGSGGFHPGVIYTHGNRSDEHEERSCVYSLSKTIRDSSDTGTYYCAVATCGQILFGEGTKVDTRSKLDPAVVVLGALLACCVTVITILMFYIKGRRACENCNNIHKPLKSY